MRPIMWHKDLKAVRISATKTFILGKGPDGVLCRPMLIQRFGHSMSMNGLWSPLDILSLQNAATSSSLGTIVSEPGPTALHPHELQLARQT